MHLTSRFAGQRIFCSIQCEWAIREIKELSGNINPFIIDKQVLDQIGTSWYSNLIMWKIKWKFIFWQVIDEATKWKVKNMAFLEFQKEKIKKDNHLTLIIWKLERISFPSQHDTNLVRLFTYLGEFRKPKRLYVHFYSKTY